jgi:asparagine synthase (glutamine-hydrolysing)
MSGICAAWMRTHPEKVSRVLDAMATGVSLSRDETKHVQQHQDVGVGLSRQFPASQQLFSGSSVVVVCDAELLNENELRRQVPDAGSGVAALLAALYQRQGESMFDGLRGGFSIILWDEQRRTLLAAIDGFGIKRLSWYDDGTRLLIASRVTAVHAACGNLAINPRAIARVLNFSASLGPETVFTDAHRLGPGIFLKATDQGTSTTRYWDMRYAAAESGDESRLARELESVVEESVAAHCTGIAKSELGAFLSGGTDSSTVVGMMTRSLGAPVKAFSIGFQEQQYDELQYAFTAVKAFGADHHTYLVSARDCEAALPDIVRSFDEPFGNASAVATYFCARLAAQNGTRTLLAGDGGDELFGGNERYATEQIFEAYGWLPQPMRTHLLEPVANLPIGGPVKKLRGYIRRAKLPGVERMFSFAFLRSHQQAEVFTADFLASMNGFDVLDVPTAHYAGANAAAHLDRLLYVDMKITLADNDLPKVTCVSELAGVRARFPFLDRRVADFSGRVPAHLKVKRFEKRYLFKKAFRGLLPMEIIRKKKHGFGIPVATWIKSDRQIRELTRDTLSPSRVRARGYFRPEFVGKLFSMHETTEAPYYGDVLWAFLMVELWHQQFVDRSARATG